MEGNADELLYCHSMLNKANAGFGLLNLAFSNNWTWASPCLTRFATNPFSMHRPLLSIVAVLVFFLDAVAIAEDKPTQPLTPKGDPGKRFAAYADTDATRHVGEEAIEKGKVVAVAVPSQHTAGGELAERTRAMPRVTEDIVPPRTDDELIRALRAAFTDPIEHRRNKVFLDLFEFLTPESAVRLVDVFAEFYDRGIQQELAWRTFWTRWGEIDGAGGLDFATDNPKFARSGHLHIELLMKGWSVVDPAAADLWLRAHPKAPYQGWMAAALAGSWAISNPDQATAAIFTLPLKPDEIDRSVSAIAETLRLTGGSQKVAAWFESLKDSAKQLAFSHAASRIKDGDIDYAKEWFTEQADKPWRDDKHLSDFINRYSNVDPAAAAQWVTSLPPSASGIQPSATSLALERWTAKDSSSASKWLNEHAGEPWWPRAARGYVAELRKVNRAAATTYLQSLDPTHRQAVERELTAK